MGYWRKAGDTSERTIPFINATCRFYSAFGSCRNGDRCSYFHHNPDHRRNWINYPPEKLAYDKLLEFKWIQKREDERIESIAEKMKNDMKTWELCKIWPWSAYGPSGITSVPSLIKEYSLEEIHWEFRRKQNWQADEQFLDKLTRNYRSFQKHRRFLSGSCEQCKTLILLTLKLPVSNKFEYLHDDIIYPDLDSKHFRKSREEITMFVFGTCFIPKFRFTRNVYDQTCNSSGRNNSASSLTYSSSFKTASASSMTASSLDEQETYENPYAWQRSYQFSFTSTPSRSTHCDSRIVSPSFFTIDNDVDMTEKNELETSSTKPTSSLKKSYFKDYNYFNTSAINPRVSYFDTTYSSTPVRRSKRTSSVKSNISSPRYLNDQSNIEVFGRDQWEATTKRFPKRLPSDNTSLYSSGYDPSQHRFKSSIYDEYSEEGFLDDTVSGIEEWKLTREEKQRLSNTQKVDQDTFRSSKEHTPRNCEKYYSSKVYFTKKSNRSGDEKEQPEIFSIPTETANDEISDPKVLPDENEDEEPSEHTYSSLDGENNEISSKVLEQLLGIVKEEIFHDMKDAVTTMSPEFLNHQKQYDFSMKNVNEKSLEERQCPIRLSPFTQIKKDLVDFYDDNQQIELNIRKFREELEIPKSINDPVNEEHELSDDVLDQFNTHVNPYFEDTQEYSAQSEILQSSEIIQDELITDEQEFSDEIETLETGFQIMTLDENESKPAKFEDEETELEHELENYFNNEAEECDQSEEEYLIALEEIQTVDEENECLRSEDFEDINEENRSSDIGIVSGSTSEKGCVIL